MKKINKIVSLFFCITILFSLCSCKTAEINRTIIKIPFSKLSIPNKVDTGTVSENDNYLLEWDKDNACIKLTSKISGDIWSSIPDKFIQSGKNFGKAALAMNSPINISYVNESNMCAIKSVTGYNGVLKKGHIGTSSIKNGIKVYYSFDNLKIIIPVSYSLINEGLNISVNPKEIIEYDKLVYSISLTPFLCSAENTNTKDNYLVVPSGSGAIMYTDNRIDGARSYSEMVYGSDPSCFQNEKLSNTETVKIPVYGAKNGNSLLCCIIESGASCAEIEAQSGDAEIGFSNINTTFHIRGSNISSVDFQGGNVRNVETVCESIGGYKTLSIGCYPLHGEKANYVGVAEKYRSTQLKKDVKCDQSDLTLNIIGGLQIDKLVLGIPNKQTVAATSFNQAKSIIKNVLNDCNTNIDVVLEGFGSTGVDIGEIAGGYSFGDAFGTKSNFKDLQTLCKKNKIPLYIDYDLVRYKKSSNGFSKMFDSAKTSNLFAAYQYQYSIALRQTLDESKYVLLKRNKLFDASNKLLKYTQKNEIHNIGVSTLGNISYSDYFNVKYYVRSSTESDFDDIMGKLKKPGNTFLMSNPNAYAAKYADKIINSPIGSSLFDSLDTDIPLYQMIFRGYNSISNIDINLLENQNIGVLKAIECGSGLSFSLIYKYNTEYATTAHSEFATSLFENNRDSIKNYVDRTRNFYAQIKNSTITEHRILSDDLRLTKFSNGATVIVNYSKDDIITNYGTVKGNDFLIIKSGDTK